MSFIEELKRRNVFRVGIAYVVVAWLTAQVAEALRELQLFSLVQQQLLPRLIMLLSQMVMASPLLSVLQFQPLHLSLYMTDMTTQSKLVQQSLLLNQVEP